MAPLARGHRVWLVNYEGLGNCALSIPVCQWLGTAGLSYFLLANPLLDASCVRESGLLAGLEGTTPPIWRRFREADGLEIVKFLHDEKIDFILNLRQIEDRGLYDRFIQRESNLGVSITMDQVGPGRPTLWIRSVRATLRSHGLAPHPLSLRWLGGLRTSRLAGVARPRVSFVVGTSQAVKRWPMASWVSLGSALAARFDSNETVVTGPGADEREFARSLAGTLGATLSEPASLDELVSVLGATDLVISLDTLAIHLASALGVPSVGIYLSTDSRIWGASLGPFTAVQSRFAQRCPFMKPLSGTCRYYYGGCPAPCGGEVTPSRVLRAAYQMLLASRAPWIRGSPTGPY